MKLNSTGHVWYVTKLSTTLSCPMNLHKYPMDTQHCPIIFESFGYTTDTMYYTWLDAPAELDQTIELPQHNITDIILYDCSQNYSAGAFPCLEIRFVIKRDVGYYVMQVYLPSSLIVILSWVTFWIDIDKVAERVSVGLVLILTMTTWNTGIQSSLPRVSYTKSIDSWMSACLAFVFFTLVEVGVVKMISRKQVDASRPVSPPTASNGQLTDVWLEIQIDNEDRNEKKEYPRNQQRPLSKGKERLSKIKKRRHSKTQKKGLPKHMKSNKKSKAQKVDGICKLVFPLAFLLFSVGYWIVYTMPSPVSE